MSRLAFVPLFLACLELGFAQQAGGPLVYSTYLGDATPSGLAVDAAGAAYVVGRTESDALPTTPGALQPALNPKICISMGFHTSRVFPCGDIFVAKMNPEGTAFDYFTYIGGDGIDVAIDIAADSAGFAYVLGGGQGLLPTTPGALQPEVGSSNIWIGKLDPAGELVWGTYLGRFSASAIAIAVDAGGAVYVTGSTRDPSLSTTPDAIQREWRGGPEGFLVKLSPDGTKILYATYLGGSLEDEITAIAIAADGAILLGGATWSADFPVTAGALQTGFWAEEHKETGFVAKMSKDGSELLYATYLGGSKSDRVTSLAADTEGNAIVAGRRESDDFPLTAGALHLSSGGFLAKLDAAGEQLLYSADAGGPEASVAADADGNAYLAARVFSPVPLSGNAVSRCGPPEVAAIFGEAVLKISPDGQSVSYGTYLSNYGGSPPLVAAGPDGGIFVSAAVLDRAVPVTPGLPFVTGPDGSSALLARIDPAGQGRVLYASSVRNGASYQAGPVAPGEWMTIFNPPLSPHEPAMVELDENGRPPTELAGLRVFFDGAPAVLTYADRCQINLIAPFGIAGAAETEVVVEQDGERSNAVLLPALDTAPALFSANATGLGQVAAINQDLTINSVDRRAAKGSVVALFGTGAGLLEPAVGDGDIPWASPPRIAADTKVFVQDVRAGWLEAEVQYAGAAPGLIAGLVQINLRIPADISVPTPLILPEPVAVKWVSGGRESRAMGVWIAP